MEHTKGDNSMLGVVPLLCEVDAMDGGTQRPGGWSSVRDPKMFLEGLWATVCGFMAR